MKRVSKSSRKSKRQRNIHPWEVFSMKVRSIIQETLDIGDSLTDEIHGFTMNVQAFNRQ